MNTQNEKYTYDTKKIENIYIIMIYVNDDELFLTYDVMKNAMSQNDFDEFDETYKIENVELIDCNDKHINEIYTFKTKNDCDEFAFSFCHFLNNTKTNINDISNINVNDVHYDYEIHDVIAKCINSFICSINEHDEIENVLSKLQTKIHHQIRDENEINSFVELIESITNMIDK